MSTPDAAPEESKADPPSGWEGLRRRARSLLEPAEEGDRASVVVDAVIICLILLDTTCFIAGSLEGNLTARLPAFERLETGILFAFVLEYFLRLWACTADPRYATPVVGRLRYSITFFAVVDLIAILPVLALVPGLGATVPWQLPVVRVFRLARLSKLMRYVGAVHIVARAFWRVRHELGALFLTMIMVTLVASTLMYGAEVGENPEQFSSVPEAMWWTVVTMTTVGYGDYVPITVLGRFIAVGVMLFGVAMFAFPAGLLGAAFVEEIRLELLKRKRLRQRRLQHADELRAELIDGQHVRCPYCERPFVPHRHDLLAPEDLQ